MNRRKLLQVGAAIVAGIGVVAWQRNSLVRWLLTRRENDSVSLSAAVSPGEEVCQLTPSTIEGPYFVKSPERSNIREDRKGIPLSLEFEIQNSSDCQPVAGATVEIWHSDASGQYSGYSADITRAPFDTMLSIVMAGGPDSTLPTENEDQFLRGAQTTDTNGRVRFETIFPGWYEPRVPHIHLKVSLGTKHYLTTQLYFPDEMSAQIYADHPEYSPYGACPYHSGNDIVLAQGDANGLLLQPTDTGSALSAAARFSIA